MKGLVGFKSNLKTPLIEGLCVLVAVKGYYLGFYIEVYGKLEEVV